jgi:DNA-binding Lrp family transcriptional regulator
MAKQIKELMTEEIQNLLGALQKNANENITTIAKECHMSKEKCIRTMRHLEKTGRIWGYTAIIDDKDMPYKKFILLVKRTLKKFDNTKADESVTKQFLPLYVPLGVHIESSYYIHGEYDWVVVFTAPDLLQAKKFSTIVFDHYPGYAEKAAILEVLFTGKAHHITNPDQSLLREYL